jgi:hypothetical protein
MKGWSAHWVDISARSLPSMALPWIDGIVVTLFHFILEAAIHKDCDRRNVTHPETQNSNGSLIEIPEEFPGGMASPLGIDQDPPCSIQ